MRLTRLNESKITTSSFSLEGRVAVVTGASRGIGAAIAEGLCSSGAVVHGVARSLEPTDTIDGHGRFQYLHSH